MRFTTAGDAERCGLEMFVHCWLDVAGAQWWRQLLAERFHDEIQAAIAKRARGDRSDVWGEVRRLAEWVATIDEDIELRGLAIPFRRAG